MTAEATHEYVLTRTHVVHETDTTVLEPTTDQRITLVTCYPFDGWTRSPWRYIATFQSR